MEQGRTGAVWGDGDGSPCSTKGSRPPYRQEKEVRSLFAIALYALAFRVFSALLAFYANVVFPLYPPEQFTMSGNTSPFWDAFTRYDSGWYFDIARNGYRYVAGGR